MTAFLEQLQYWHWLVLAVVLVVLEIFSPGVFFLWLGIAAGIVGALLGWFPEFSWQLQLLAFGSLSLLSVGVVRVYLRRHPIESDQPTLNRRGEQYVGRVFTLEVPIVNGQGKIKVDDSTWKIHGEDCAVGTRVRVEGADGVVLLVEKAP